MKIIGSSDKKSQAKINIKRMNLLKYYLDKHIWYAYFVSINFSLMIYHICPLKLHCEYWFPTKSWIWCTVRCDPLNQMDSIGVASIRPIYRINAADQSFSNSYESFFSIYATFHILTWNKLTKFIGLLFGVFVFGFYFQ